MSTPDEGGTPVAGSRIDHSAPTEAAAPAPLDVGPPSLTTGDVLAGRYRIGGLLGRGGMGEIYEARDLDLEEDVALKLLRRELSSDSSYRRRLRSEVRLARRVTHPNVCRVHDLGTHGDQVFVTMARVSGKSLRQVLHAIRDGELPRLPLTTIVDLVSQLCAALGAAHAAGVLHRDVKPDNILVEHGRAVLTDFGVASGTGEVDGALVGTPAYTAPELLRGEPVDGRADVYSAAVVAYELLAGQPPFIVESMKQAEIRAFVAEPPPPLPAGVAAGARQAALDRVLRAGLEAEPHRRLPTPAALAEGLAAALRVPVEGGDGDGLVPPPSTEPVTVGTARRRVEARVATVLTFVGARGTVTASDDPYVTPETRGGEELERAVVDLGGWPVAAGPSTVTALFGVPSALGDDAMRAVRAARRLLAQEHGGRVGIDTRRVMVRPDGASCALLATPREVARVADALALAAPGGDVWLSAAAARQVAGHLDVAPAGDVGGERALRLASGSAANSAVIPRGGPVRARELARLEDVARACFERRVPRVVEIRGTPGAGKSQLRAAFMARVSERRDVEWLVATAAPLGEAAALSLVRAAHPGWFEAASAAGEGATRAATLAAARRWLEERATRRPVAVLFDDLHWADEVSRDLLVELATNLEALPVLVVVLGRDPSGVPGAEVIELGPLDDETALRLARETAPAASEEALADVVARAGGNPFFVEELARDLGERGASLTTLPPTVEAVVQARLERLSPVAAALLGAASVVGRAFWREAARAALPEPVPDAVLDAALAELERRALAFPAPPGGLDDDRYELAHALIRDVAYQRMSPRDRRTAHAAVARWLGEQLEGGGHSTPTSSSGAIRLPADPELLLALAHHREHGGDPTGAARAWRTAGLRSLELYAYRQAHAALRRAWELAGAAADAELAEHLGDAAFQADTLEAAEEAYAAAVARTAATDDAAHARLAYRRGQVASARGDHAGAVAHYQRGLDLLVPGGELTPSARRDPRQAALLFASLGWVRSYQLGSDDPAALAACERAVELLEGTLHRRELAHALSRLGGAYMRTGRWADQRRCNQRTLELSLGLGDLAAQATAHINLGVVLGNLGELAAAIDHTERALALSRRTGARPTIGLSLSNLAGYHLEQGDLARADALLAEGVEVLEAIGQRRVLLESWQFAARIAARRGDLPAARAAIARSLELARATGNPGEEAVCQRIAAQLAVLAGALPGADRAAALAAAEAALATARRLSDGADAFERARLDAATARVHDLAGRPAAAAAARAAARAVFTRLGALPDLRSLDDATAVR